MGWAKYYEDNVSIYNNRMRLKNSGENIVVNDYVNRPRRVMPQINCAQIIEYKKVPRAELSLSFESKVGAALARKLQMNGWWFSKAKNCWCNYNSSVNRAYAQRLALTITVKIVPITWSPAGSCWS